MKKTGRIICLLCTMVMCFALVSCFDESSSKTDKRGDMGKLIALTPYNSTVIKGVQLEHQGMWIDEPEIDEIVKKSGFSAVSDYYEFELGEWFGVYIKSSTRDTFTNYLVKYDESKDYKSITEDEIKGICLDKSLEDTEPDEKDYGYMGCLKVEKDKGSTGTYAVVIFRFGKPEAMMKVKIVPSTAPSASAVLKELDKQKSK